VKHPVQNGVGESIKEMALKISELRLLILQFRNNYRVNFLRLVGTEKESRVNHLRFWHQSIMVMTSE
jgi:hypothetical protein